MSKMKIDLSPPHQTIKRRHGRCVERSKYALSSHHTIWWVMKKRERRGKELAYPLLFLAERFRDEGRNEGIEK